MQGSGERRGGSTHGLCLILRAVGNPCKGYSRGSQGAGPHLDGAERLRVAHRSQEGEQQARGPGSSDLLVYGLRRRQCGLEPRDGRGAEAKSEGLGLFPANRTWHLLRHRVEGGGVQVAPRFLTKGWSVGPFCWEGQMCGRGHDEQKLGCVQCELPEGQLGTHKCPGGWTRLDLH